MVTRRAVLVLVVLALAGCGSRGAAKNATPPVTAPAPTSTTSTTTPIPATDRSALEDALQTWTSFPVHASPRPLVLTTDPVAAPASGFATDDAKEAFLSGLFTAPARLPAAPSEAGGYEVVGAVGAVGALAFMRASGSRAPGQTHPPSPLVVDAVRFGSASFGTDRGRRTLPAWFFSFRGVQDPSAVLAVAPSLRFFPAGVTPGTAQLDARIAPDGRTLTVTFTGSPPGPGPCGLDYTIDQLATDTAVAITVRPLAHEPPLPPHVACPLIGAIRHQAVTLAAPLGDRVLVDARTKAPVAIAH